MSFETTSNSNYLSQHLILIAAKALVNNSSSADDRARKLQIDTAEVQNLLTD